MSVGFNNGNFTAHQSIIDPQAAADAAVQYNESGVAKWRHGNYETDDSWRLSQGSALGNNDTMIVSTAGEIKMPLQPAFYATKTSSQANATGNDVNVTVSYSTEIFDQGGDYDGSTTFTAPVTGRYTFYYTVLYGGVSTQTTSSANLVTSNRGYIGNAGTAARADSNANLDLWGSFIADMDAMDTATISTAAGPGGTPQTITLVANGNRGFGGKLEC